MRTPTAQLMRRVGVVHANDRFRYATNFPLRVGIALQDGDTYNTYWRLFGTNMTSALSTFAAGGGITLTTAGASADNARIYPQRLQVPTVAKSPGFYTRVKTGASVQDTQIVAGFYDALTPFGSFTTGGGSTLCRFAYDRAEFGNGNWWCNVIDSSASPATREVFDTGVEVEASTTYELAIEVDANRLTRFSLRRKGHGWRHNQAQAKRVFTSTTASLYPYVGVQANAAAAKALTIRKLAYGMTE